MQLTRPGNVELYRQESVGRRALALSRDLAFPQFCVDFGGGQMWNYT